MWYTVAAMKTKKRIPRVDLTGGQGLDTMRRRNLRGRVPDRRKAVSKAACRGQASWN